MLSQSGKANRFNPIGTEDIVIARAGLDRQLILRCGDFHGQAIPPPAHHHVRCRHASLEFDFVLLGRIRHLFRCKVLPIAATVEAGVVTVAATMPVIPGPADQQVIAVIGGYSPLPLAIAMPQYWALCSTDEECAPSGEGVFCVEQRGTQAVTYYSMYNKYNDLQETNRRSKNSCNHLY